MHVLIVTDQHADSLGGVQVSIRLQRRFLERLGHTVTVAAPELHRPGYRADAQDHAAYINLPSLPITRDGEYGVAWPGARTDRALAAGLRGRPPVEVVHVQGDFWGAMIGLRAARGLSAASVARGAKPVPVVHTMHNNVDEGTRAVARLLAPTAFWGLRAWRGAVLGRVRGEVSGKARGAWRYLAELASEATLVTAPSQHFATELEAHGVAAEVVVTPNGVDDELVSEVRARGRSAERGTQLDRPRFVWLGRMSHEKRVLEFVDAIARSGIDADVTLYGSGLLLPRVRARIAQLGIADRVSIHDPVSYEGALEAMRNADALVQTSVGFETQGLTPFEAAALGTPTIFCDPNIANDVEVSPAWVARDASIAALAEALREAVSDLQAASNGMRVSQQAGQRFLQSAQTNRMVELYERALRGV